MTRPPTPAPSVHARTSSQDAWTVLAQDLPELGDALHVTAADQHDGTRIEACRVRTECLTEALDHEVESGFWGGKTARERRSLRREHSEVKSWRRLLQDLEEGHRLFAQASEPPAPHRSRRGMHTSDASVQASEPPAPHRSRRGVHTCDASVGDADAVPTVLVADDEPDVRELARILLEMDGFEVVGEAIDGQDALDRFVALNPPPVPTAIVLDNRMPGLTGLQVAALILERHPDQVIVLLTAFLDEHVEQQAREIGVTACLSKRYAADLPGVLRNLLGI